MAETKMIQINPSADFSAIINGAAQILSGQGFEVVTTFFGPESATLNVKKDMDDGLKKLVGLGIECTTTVSKNGYALNVSTEHEWTNKIIAIAVGWFFCLVPFITGIVGAVNQSSLPDKICSALTAAANGGAPPMNNGYNNYQAPPAYQQNQQYQQNPQYPQYPQNPQY